MASAKSAASGGQRRKPVGVVRTPRGGLIGKWKANLKHEGKDNYLGTFDSAEEAARAYDACARRLRGKQAHGGRNSGGQLWLLNFPTETEVMERASADRVAKRKAVDPGAKSSQHRGVSWDSHNRRWRASYDSGPSRCFVDEEDAAKHALSSVAPVSNATSPALGRRGSVAAEQSVADDRSDQYSTHDDAAQSDCAKCGQVIEPGQLTWARNGDHVGKRYHKACRNLPFPATCPGVPDPAKPGYRSRPVRARKASAGEWTRYESIRLASVALDVDGSGITKCCKRGCLSKGYEFAYADDLSSTSRPRTTPKPQPASRGLARSADERGTGQNSKKRKTMGSFGGSTRDGRSDRGRAYATRSASGTPNRAAGSESELAVFIVGDKVTAKYRRQVDLQWFPYQGTVVKQVSEKVYRVQFEDGDRDDVEAQRLSRSNWADDMVCQVCVSGDDAANMILCDGCQDGYHINCVSLEAVPTDEWFCPHCVADVKQREQEQNSRRLEELRKLEELRVQEVCHVCFETFADMHSDREVKTLSCKHSFCSECIEAWFNTADASVQKCPACRRVYASLRRCETRLAAKWRPHNRGSAAVAEEAAAATDASLTLPTEQPATLSSSQEAMLQVNEARALQRQAAGRPTSERVGVSWDKKERAWLAMIGRKRLGCFSEEVDAAKAYDKQARKDRGIYAHGGRTSGRRHYLNFPTAEEAQAVDAAQNPGVTTAAAEPSVEPEPETEMRRDPVDTPAAVPEAESAVQNRQAQQVAPPSSTAVDELSREGLQPPVQQHSSVSVTAEDAQEDNLDQAADQIQVQSTLAAGAPREDMHKGMSAGRLAQEPLGLSPSHSTAQVLRLDEGMNSSDAFRPGAGAVVATQAGGGPEAVQGAYYAGRPGDQDESDYRAFIESSRWLLNCFEKRAANGSSARRWEELRAFVVEQSQAANAEGSSGNVNG